VKRGVRGRRVSELASGTSYTVRQSLRARPARHWQTGRKCRPAVTMMRMAGPAARNSIRVSSRISGFVYAIRNIVAEARKVEASGRRVRYLNIGDPIAFGFATPPHLIEAVDRAMRDGHNGYTASIGILSAREAVAADYTKRGMQVSPDHVVLTSGTSEGIELTLGALADEGDEVLVPTPTYPLYTAVLAKLGARPVYYRLDPSNGWQPEIG